MIVLVMKPGIPFPQVDQTHEPKFNPSNADLVLYDDSVQCCSCGENLWTKILPDGTHDYSWCDPCLHQETERDFKAKLELLFEDFKMVPVEELARWTEESITP